MSGFIGTAETVISELIGAVSIGGVTLFGFEVPEALKWGGKQKIEIHKLPGGDRVFNVMGADDDSITWSGYFSGPLASFRARSIDQMRSAGQPVTLIWPGFTRNVIIESFTCTSARGGFLLPYTISCEVIPDQVTDDPSILDQITSDFSDATGIDLPDVSDAFTVAQTALAAAQTLLPVAGVLTAGSAAVGALTVGIGTALDAITGGFATDALSAAAMLAGPNVLGAVAPVYAIANLAGALSWTQNEAGLAQMQGDAERIATNLANAGG